MSKEFTPMVVAKSFTKQYYEILHSKPQQLYRFYKDESNFFHGDENQVSIYIYILTKRKKKTFFILFYFIE